MVSGDTTSKKHSFLVVDDDRALSAMAERALAAAFPGCAVTIVSDGNAALSTASKAEFDVIVLDVNIPGLDGFDVCKALKSDPAAPRAPVIMITGERLDPISKNIGLELGADSFLYKPFRVDELISQVKVMLRIKAAEDTLRRQKDELQKAFNEQTIELQKSRDDLEKKVVELEGTIARQTQDLIKADRLAAVGILAAGLAHEVNNPNTFIGSNLQTFKMFWKELEPALAGLDDPDSKRRQRLNFIFQEMPGVIKGMEEGVKRISSIVRGMKSYASGHSGEQRIIDMGEVIESALRLVWNHIKYDIEVRKDIPPDLPKVYGIEQMLCQVFVNLFLNAAHAIKEHKGEGALTVTGGVDADRYVVISVSDTGHGIPPEQMRNLFNPFYTTRRDRGGTGLGLFVSHGIIKGHNGVMEVESVVDKGTTFRVKIPMISKDQSVEAVIEGDVAAG